jgi:hypothetical protein
MPEWLRSLLRDVSTIFGDGSTLFRLNARLAMLETQQNLGRLVVTIMLGVGALMFGSLFVLFGVLTIFYALLAYGFMPYVAGLIVTVALFLLTCVLVLIVKARLASWSIVPSRALQQWDQNISTLKGRTDGL